MTRRRALERIVATTDVHSSFHQAAPMLTYLHAARQQALVVDCGDFFEGSGFYRLGGGDIERRILIQLYNVLAPGNHGWRHHLEADLRVKTVSANVIDAGTGEPLFRRLHIDRVGGRRVGVTGVIGEHAFATIPRNERAGHDVVEPGRALHDLRHHYRDAVDDWIVLSHAGFDHDLALAAACPFITTIFSGHCHSPEYGPVRIGDTLVVKGHELSEGYAQAAPGEPGWTTRVRAFPDAPAIPAAVTALAASIEALHDRLAQPIGPVAEPYRNMILDRRHTLTLISQRLRERHAGVAVLLNETSLRPLRLGTVLRQGDLLTIEPFANNLVRAHVADLTAGNTSAFLDTLSAHVGPLIVDQDAADLRCVFTTRYLADTFLGGRWNGPPFPLADVVRAVLTGQRGERP